jgi:methylamine dehydrogenase accessory protein MauD
MDSVLLLARLLLASVFALAGIAKLADREGSRQAIIDFGLPAALATPLGILLPLTELAVALALVPASSAWWAAVGALTLLLLFMVGIGVNLARGRKPECHCFGQLHSSPAGWKTLARNGALALVASSIIWQGSVGGSTGGSVLGWLGGLAATPLVGLILGLVALALVLGQWWFLANVLRQNGRLLVRVEALEAKLGAGGEVPSVNGGQAQRQTGLAVGSEAPGFTLSGLHGETLTLDSLRSSGEPVMLLFTDPNCGPCNALLPEVGRWQEENSDKLTVSLISRGTAEENRTKVQEHALENVLLQEDWEVSEAYQVGGTPSAVLVGEDGKVNSSVASGPDAIRRLVTRLLRPQPPIPVTKRVGDVAPEVRLPDLEGNIVELADLRGKQTLVLFWSPGCGFCQQMLPDLKEWEARAPEGAPRLLVVSAGAEEVNREMGLTSPVLLDQNFATGRAFGAGGTPSAVLVDAEGKVASGVAVGARAVMELARADKTTT